MEKCIPIWYTIGEKKPKGGYPMSAILIDKDNFEREVMQSDKPVLLDFWAPWCGPCRAVLPLVEEIAAERQDWKVGKVNVDEQKELARKFRVMSIPTLLVIRNSEVVDRSTGEKDKEAILAMM